MNFRQSPLIIGTALRNVAEPLPRLVSISCESYVNLQALRDPAPRILDSVGISRKLRIKSYVILQAWRGPAPRFSDRVVKSKNYPFESYANLHAIRDPMLHLRERGGGSENGPRLSLGNGATFGPKTPCFAVVFLTASPRLRARAPYIRGSSRGLANPRAGVADLT